jgi:excisionase family DNA binding protein
MTTMTATQGTSEAISLAEAANRYGQSLRTLTRRVQQTEIPGHKVRGLRGLEWRIYPEDLEHFLCEHRRGTTRT